MNWFKIGKGVHQGCTLYAEYIMQGILCQMPDWINHKLESRLPGEISITSYADDTTLMARSEEELKEPLDESERGE